MARFVKCKARMQRSDDLLDNERLGLEIKVEEVFNDVCVDLDVIVVAMHHYSSDGDIIPGYSEVVMNYGGYMIIDIDFLTLQNLLMGQPAKPKKKPNEKV